MNDSLIPNTTLEEDRKTHGKRVINLTWELTQAFLAFGVMIGIIIMSIRGGGAPPELVNAFFVIIGFYFGRTNHARPGG